MPKINHQIPASGALPENYQEVLSWKVTGKPMRVIVLNILGVFLFVIIGMAFSSIAISVGKMPSEDNFRLALGEIGLAAVGIVVAFVLHELTHGLVMQGFGASPNYVIIALAPVVILMWGFALVVAVRFSKARAPKGLREQIIGIGESSI